MSKRVAKADDKPKKALAAYAFFTQACREEALKENKKLAFAEFNKQCGEQWKVSSLILITLVNPHLVSRGFSFQVMSEKDKQRFVAMAEKDKVRYASQMKNYTPSGDGDTKQSKGKKTKAKKDPNAPKRPL
jgi:hypothetical protein